MNNKRWMPLLAVAGYILAGCASAANNDAILPQSKADTVAKAAAAPIHWTPSKQPPMPEIMFDVTRPVAISLVGYTWCSPDHADSCTNVQASIAQEVVTTAPAGAKLVVKAPEGVKSFTIVNENAGFMGDAYVVPNEQGVYRYSLHCDWTFNQAKTDYVFTLEVM